MKRIAILGSTGSIGVNTLKVVSSLKERFEVVGLAANSNIRILAAQAKAFRPRIVSVTDQRLEKELLRLVPSRQTKVVSGEEGLIEIVSRGDVDMVVFAASGASSLRPLLEAIGRGKDIALANKEALVCAGEIVTSLAKSKGVRLIPIDSEHSAIFQCLEGQPRAHLKRIFLTSSGGPLLKVRKERFRHLSKEVVLRHPRWKMGRKITVDSATLMNKGLEIIEARWLFDVDARAIRVVVHPEAIVHSLVELVDNSILAQLAVPDMRLPIQYALTYPERCESPVASLDLATAGSLTFLEPDLEKFPCLSLAREALRRGGTYPAVLNAADEEAVALFLEGEITFDCIPKVVEDVLAHHRAPRSKCLTLEEVTAADSWARREVRVSCCR